MAPFRTAYAVVIIVLAGLSTATGASRTSVSQYGITWTFDRAYETGQFVTGDWYVVGPVTITSVSPAPTGTRNGSVVNPVGGKQGYDDRGGRWTASEAATFPLTLQADQSLVSAVSNPDQTNCTSSSTNGWTNYAGGCSRGIMQTAAVLTCLASAPAEPSFRPPYAGDAYKPVFPVSRVNWSLLPKLASPPTLPDPNSIIRGLQRPWIDHQNGWTLQYTHPMDNHPGYGRDMANRVSSAACYVLLDEPKADSVAILLIQLGIDNYGVTEAGGYWMNDGGHALGRKFPILFAARMLGDATLASIGQRSGSAMYADGYGPGRFPAGFVHFGEDGQTFYITQNPDPAGAWAAGTDENYDIYVPDGSGNYRPHSQSGFSWFGHGDASKDKDFLEYTDAHEGMPEWGIRHSTEPNRDGLDWGAPYRNGTNGDPYEGYILAAHVLGLKTMWNHAPLFDYTDRFIDLDGIPASFIGFMWSWYRHKYDCVWTRDDSTDNYSNGAPDCSRCEFNCPGDTLSEDDVRESVHNTGIAVWPNPSNGAVEFRGAAGGTVEIRDVAGVIVHSNRVVGTGRNLSQNTQLEWNGSGTDGSTVPPGLYFYTVTTPQGTHHGRIMRTE